MWTDAISKNRKDEQKEIKNAVPVTLHINNILKKKNEHNVSNISPKNSLNRANLTSNAIFPNVLVFP